MQLRVRVRKIKEKVIAIIQGRDEAWVLSYLNTVTQITFPPLFCQVEIYVYYIY